MTFTERYGFMWCLYIVKKRCIFSYQEYRRLFVFVLSAKNDIVKMNDFQKYHYYEIIIQFLKVYYILWVASNFNVIWIKYRRNTFMNRIQYDNIFKRYICADNNIKKKGLRVLNNTDFMQYGKHWNNLIIMRWFSKQWNIIRLFKWMPVETLIIINIVYFFIPIELNQVQINANNVMSIYSFYHGLGIRIEIKRQLALEIWVGKIME